MLIDCCIPTCTCTHATKTSFFLGQILNSKTSFFLGWREYYTVYSIQYTRDVSMICTQNNSRQQTYLCLAWWVNGGVPVRLLRTSFLQGNPPHTMHPDSLFPSRRCWCSVTDDFQSFIMHLQLISRKQSLIFSRQTHIANLKYINILLLVHVRFSSTWTFPDSLTTTISL
jgi:hypothetical protein